MNIWPNQIKMYEETNADFEKDIKMHIQTNQAHWLYFNIYISFVTIKWFVSAILPYGCHKQSGFRFCYTDHICVSDTLNNSQQLHEKCKPCRSVLIRGDKWMWSSISLITADDKPCRNPSLLRLSARRFCDHGTRVLIGRGRSDINSQQSRDACHGSGGAGWWLCWALTQSGWDRWIMCTQAWGREAEGQADLQHQQTGGSERFI